LLLVDDDLLELGLAIVADVFVDRHSLTLLLPHKYSNFQRHDGVGSVKAVPRPRHGRTSTMMQSKLIARTHRTDIIRVPPLPAAASTRNSGVKRTTTALKERHLATHAHPKRSTSHGIVRTAITQTAKSPETERIAIQSTTVFQRGLSGRLLALRNLNHTKKARKGGDTSDRKPNRLNMGFINAMKPR
jgi:hypothetical protein